MAALDIRHIYSNGFRRLRIGDSASQILTKMTEGDLTAQDFEEAVKSDRFFTSVILENGSRRLKHGKLGSLAQAVSLMGEEKVRDFILSQTILRAADPLADFNFKSFSGLKRVLRRAEQARERAEELGDVHPNIAFGVGFLFDFFEFFFNQEPYLNQNFLHTFHRTWRVSFRAATIAQSLIEVGGVEVSNERIIFGAALGHDLGRLLLCFAAPEKYKVVSKKVEQAGDTDEFEEQEMNFEEQEIGCTHVQVGSILLSSIKHTLDLEEICDFHHSYGVFKIRNPNMFTILSLLSFSDRLAQLFESKPVLDLEDIQKVLEKYKDVFDLTAKGVEKILLTLGTKNLLI